MSTLQLLVVDITNLAVEAKRRNNEVKAACDVALARLKPHESALQLDNGLPLNDTECRDVAAPFILSLLSGNVKLATLSVPVLQRLINAHFVPSGQIESMLDSLGDAANLSIDIQLRTLQCMPSVMQAYRDALQGDLLRKLLAICSGMTANNKSTVVINTALATLQQLFSAIYDRVPSPSGQIEHNVTIDEDQVVSIDLHSLEAFKIFDDLCKLASQEEPIYLPPTMRINTLAVFELLENIVANHKPLFQTQQEFGYLLRQKLVPLLLKALNKSSTEGGKVSFQTAIRTMRIIQVLICLDLLEVIELESEVILSYLNHFLSEALSGNRTTKTDEGKRSNGVWEYMVLEVYRHIFQDFDLIRKVFLKFDAGENSKRLLQELISTLSTYIQHDARIRQTKGLRPLESSESALNSSAISRHSNLKISILDHLDKAEPPSNIPPTYAGFLILHILTTLCEGISRFVTSLSNQKQDPKSIEADVEFISMFIEVGHANFLTLFGTLLYTSMDNESFHGIIRAIQKYTHTTGLLGLGDLRDGLLLLISAAIIDNVELPHERGEADQDLRADESGILSLSESIAESLGIQEKQVDTSAVILGAGKFNSRNVTCFRALVNLAVSLGSTLDSSWKIIWITFQWCDYFINGPETQRTNSGKVKTPEVLNPALSISDRNNVENSKKKFLDSINEYQQNSFHSLIKSLTELSQPKDHSSEPLKICPHNQTFFMNQLVVIAAINPIKFLIEEDDAWILINHFFTGEIALRDNSFGLRIYAVQKFNFFVQNTTIEGLQSSDKSINGMTATKSLEALMGVLERMYKSGQTLELLVMNCETEIRLLILTALHQMIDKYDTYYQNSWDIVFKIVNSSFSINGAIVHGKGDRLRLLLSSSFETLKLILDEFIFSLPFDQVKILIDTLFNFSKQEVDLNILFSAVSYFWLVGDSIKKKVTESSEQKPTDVSLTGEADLSAAIEDSTDYTLLDVYLLLTLSKISHDSRAQVRDGAIQTFFQIVDVHGALFTLGYWNIIYELLLPKFLKLELQLDDANFDKKDWIESLDLMLSGLVSLYLSFFIDSEHSIRYWKGLIDYFGLLLSLKWIDLNVLVFKCLKDCLIPLQSNDSQSKQKICDMLFEFWLTVPIEYDFLNPLFQDSLTKLMHCFPSLYSVVEGRLTIDDAQSILNKFNSCARYPVLPESYSDEAKPSMLQQAVLDNLRAFKGTSAAVKSIIMQQLAGIVVLPFAVRTRIEEKIGSKLQGKHLKTPTFVAISALALNLLGDRLREFKEFAILIEDKGVIKILRSLLEVVEAKFDGIIKGSSTRAWTEANTILRFVIVKIVENDRQGNPKAMSADLWGLMLAAIKLSLHTHDLQYEYFNIEQYHALVDLVLPRLKRDSVHVDFVQDFIEEVYNCSFVYAINDTEATMVLGSGTINDFTAKLSTFDFDQLFGTTEPLEIVPSKLTARTCLAELIRFASSPQVSTTLNEKSLSYFVCRLLFSLRRFIADESLLNKAPLPWVQREELLTILKGIIEVLANLRHSSQSHEMLKLQPLLVKCVPYSTRIKGLSELIEKAMLSMKNHL